VYDCKGLKYKLCATWRKSRTRERERDDNKDKNRERGEDEDYNNFLHDIHKSVQPPKFSGGISFKPNIVFSFLDMLEKCFDGELPKKEKVRAFSLLLRERAHNKKERLKDFKHGALSI
jgi:hypothetical protein